MESKRFSDFVKKEALENGVSEEQVLKNIDSIISGRGAIYRTRGLDLSTPSGLFYSDGAIYRTKIWATAKSIRAEIADIPEHTLAEFAVAHPEDVRKYGESRNSTLVFRTAAVLKFIEDMKEAK